MTTFFIPPVHVRYGYDADGAILCVKRLNEVVPLIIDWSDRIGSVTISSVAYVDNGVTRTSTSNTTTTTTTYVNGIGETEITLTLSTGEIIQRVARFYEEEGGENTGDYCE